MRERSLTQTKTTPKPSFTPVQTGILQRKCTCGNSAGLTGKCTECENKRLTLQRRSTNEREPDEVPPIVHEVLRSPDQLSHQTTSQTMGSLERKRSETGVEESGAQAQSESPTNTKQSDEITSSENPLRGPFFSVDQAARAFGDLYNPLSIAKCEEICSIFVREYLKPPGAFAIPFPIYYYIRGWQHREQKKRESHCTPLPPMPPFNGKKPVNFAGEIHTHGCDDPKFDSENFSDEDKSGCRETGGPCYIVTPKGAIKKFEP